MPRKCYGHGHVMPLSAFLFCYIVAVKFIDEENQRTVINHRPSTRHWHMCSYRVVSSRPRHDHSSPSQYFRFSYLYSKFAKYDGCIYRIWRSDWTFFENGYKTCTWKFYDWIQKCEVAIFVVCNIALSHRYNVDVTTIRSRP